LAIYRFIYASLTLIKVSGKKSVTDFVGGEFWYDLRYQTNSAKIPAQGMIYLNGGEAAIRLICDFLISHGVREILIPSYVCPTIADAFDRYGVTYSFYIIQDNFRIDLDNLLKIAPGFKVLYVINYFGYGFTNEEMVVLNQLKAQGMMVIEDDAQGGFNRVSVANVRFNSLRKIVPYDGSLFYSDRDMSQNLKKFVGLPNNRLPVIRQYRQTFARLITDGAENFDVLNPLFDQSERHYYTDLTVLGDSDERTAVERLDWAEIEATRKANHLRLCNQLAEVPEIEVIFSKVSPHGPPLGFPIYIKNGQRDAMLNYLREWHVYPLVHWDILDDSRINKIPKTVAMSTKIITLILDQRFSLEDMDYEASLVRGFFGH
jgi:hypothetical protein